MITRVIFESTLDLCIPPRASIARRARVIAGSVSETPAHSMPAYQVAVPSSDPSFENSQPAAVRELFAAQIALALLRVARAERPEVALEHQARRGPERAREVESFPAAVSSLQRAHRGVRAIDRVLHARLQRSRTASVAETTGESALDSVASLIGSCASLSIRAQSVAHSRAARCVAGHCAERGVLRARYRAVGRAPSITTMV